MAPKVQDLPNMVGEGVALPKDRTLDKLGDQFIECRDKKAKLASDLGDLETKIIERMGEKGLKFYRFGDQQMEIKETKLHVKLRTIEVDGVESEDLENEDD